MDIRKQAYFDVTGELMLDVIKQQCDLPEDTKLTIVMSHTEPGKGNQIKAKNVIRFFVVSDEFPSIEESGVITRLDPTCYAR